MATLLFVRWLQVWVKNRHKNKKFGLTTERTATRATPATAQCSTRAARRHANPPWVDMRN
ncbi:MAG: hypothetical protein PUD58_04840 [Prevotella sp.]|uniref:hypothetical protein n=1 Tax=Prevotella sp. TaxID=59823 RepID=UPI00258A26AF|nr:hypothetical protein [Prevotella sp.]MDD6853619.1 hypothetical protein [Prevotella sp.]